MTVSSGHQVCFFSRRPPYIFLAEYGHCVSMAAGHVTHRSPAPGGIDSRRKCLSAPKDDTLVHGRATMYRSQSMSWQLLASRIDDDCASLRHLPRTKAWAMCQ